MPHPTVLAEIVGPDLLIILAIAVLFFGGNQIPKLARSLGEASKEFRDGVARGAQEEAPPASRDDAGPPRQDGA